MLADKENYRIVKVETADIPLFQKRHATEILCDADALAELLAQFAAKLETILNKSG
jgi:hypothetical protein